MFSIFYSFALSIICLPYNVIVSSDNIKDTDDDQKDNLDTVCENDKIESMKPLRKSLGNLGHTWRRLIDKMVGRGLVLVGCMGWAIVWEGEETWWSML